MKTLLLGGNGQLGRRFLDDGGLAARGELVITSRDGSLTGGATGEVADLSLPRSLNELLDRVKPDLIVNAAAYTAVDRAEDEEQLAARVNGEAVGALGQWAASHSAKIIHFSTDYVFDGEQLQPYAIDAPTAPLGAYGRSKLLGENALRTSGADHLILRTAWVYGAHGQNFLNSMLRLAKERDSLRVVADQYGAPTDTSLIVRGTLAALDRWREPGGNALGGTYHLVARGHTTWHGFAEAIFDHASTRLLLINKPKVSAITTSEYPMRARRPRSSILDTTSFEKNFGIELPDWQTGLSAVMDQLTHAGHP